MAIRDPALEMPSLRLFRALYRALDSDLATCYRYVEPVEANAETFSTEFMRLHAQACMGLGSLLDLWYERLLRDNPEKKNRPGITDYFPLLQDRLLLIDPSRDLEVRGNPAYLVRPFRDWSAKIAPKWWSDYNDTKHHFTLETFKLGNLENALKALGGFYIMLHDWRTLRTNPLDSKVFEAIK